VGSKRRWKQGGGKARFASGNGTGGKRKEGVGPTALPERRTAEGSGTKETLVIDKHENCKKEKRCTPTGKELS